MNKIFAYTLTVATTAASFLLLMNTSNAEEDRRQVVMQPSFQTAPANPDAAPSAGLSMQQIADNLVAQYGGEVLEIEREHENGRAMFEVKGVDAQGRYYKLYLDAQTGQTMLGDDDD